MTGYNFVGDRRTPVADVSGTARPSSGPRPRSAELMTTESGRQRAAAAVLAGN